jgi:hypothetical protein
MLPFSIFLLGWQPGLALFFLLAGVSFYSFRAVAKSMESDTASKTGLSLQRMSVAFLSLIAFGPRFHSFFKFLVNLDSILTQLFMLAMLVKEIALLFNFSLVTSLIIVSFISAFFGLSNEPNFFFFTDKRVTPIACVVIFAGLLSSSVSSPAQVSTDCLSGIDISQLLPDQVSSSLSLVFIYLIDYFFSFLFFFLLFLSFPPSLI